MALKLGWKNPNHSVVHRLDKSNVEESQGQAGVKLFKIILQPSKFGWRTPNQNVVHWRPLNLSESHN